MVFTDYNIHATYIVFEIYQKTITYTAIIFNAMSV